MDQDLNQEKQIETQQDVADLLAYQWAALQRRTLKLPLDQTQLLLGYLLKELGDRLGNEAFLGLWSGLIIKAEQDLQVQEQEQAQQDQAQQDQVKELQEKLRDLFAEAARVAEQIQQIQ